MFGYLVIFFLFKASRLFFHTFPLFLPRFVLCEEKERSTIKEEETYWKAGHYNIPVFLEKFSVEKERIVEVRKTKGNLAYFFLHCLAF